MNAQWTAGFYAAGNGVEPYSSIPWSMYTSVVHFAATPGSNGTVSLGYLTQSDISSFIASRPSGKKAILCISDAPGGSFANNTTSSLVGTFASNIANFVNSNGYDGVDFDWEQNVNVTQFNTFLQQMRSALPGKLITTDMGNWNSLQSVAAASQSYLDQINIMCYDLDYSAGYSWYVDAVLQAGNTSVMTCDWRVNAFTSAGVAASKIGVGMPFYGRVYSGVTAAQQSSGNGSTVLYRNLVTNSSYWQPQYQGYDSAHKGQYLSIPSPATWISYTGTEEIGDIVSWAKSKGYGGYMTYSLD